MPVDAKTVKELRERTGLPMMECKRALEKTDGDVDKAIEELRKSGAKAVEKLSGRKANEGRVASQISNDGRLGALVALRCETEPVAGNEEFVRLAAELVEVLVREAPADRDAFLAARLPRGTTVSEGVTDLVNKLRENISVGAFARLEGEAVAQYVHFDSRRAGMVALSGGSVRDAKVAEIGKDICMHIVFSKPIALSRDRLDDALIEKEREILTASTRNDPKNAKKPDEIIDKIVAGQLNRFIAERCLLEQEFIRDEEKRPVAKFLEAGKTGLEVVDFAYVATDLE